MIINDYPVDESWRDWIVVVGAISASGGMTATATMNWDVSRDDAVGFSLRKTAENHPNCDLRLLTIGKIETRKLDIKRLAAHHGLSISEKSSPENSI